MLNMFYLVAISTVVDRDWYPLQFIYGVIDRLVVAVSRPIEFTGIRVTVEMGLPDPKSRIGTRARETEFCRLLRKDRT